MQELTINLRLKNELKNAEKLMEETVQALWTENVHSLIMCEITFPGSWSLKIKCGP